MAKLEKTVSIKAPAEKIFSFINDPRGLPEVWPSMVEVRNVHPGPVGGNNFDWTYKMAGMLFKGSTEQLESTPNQRLVSENKKGIPSKFVWTCQPEADGTRLNLQVEYTVPVPLVGKVAEAFIIKLNQNEMDVMLANLKARMEA